MTRISDHRRTKTDRKNGFTGRSPFKRTASKGSSWAAYVRAQTTVNNNRLAVERMNAAAAETA